MLTSTSSYQKREQPAIGVLLLTFVRRAINFSVPWAGGGDGIHKGHSCFNLPGHWSFVELVAKLWLESVFPWQLPIAETEPSVHLLGAGVSQGTTALSEVGRISCSAVSAGRQGQHLTPNQLLLLSGSGLALTPPAWDWSPFWSCGRCRSPGPASYNHTSVPCRQVSLCFPGSPFSSHSFLTGWLGTLNFFFIFLLLLLCKCSHLTALDYWDL